MDLQKELYEIKALLNEILEKKEDKPITEEECKKNKEISERSLLEHTKMVELQQKPLE
jgi:hypothetical protein